MLLIETKYQAAQKGPEFRSRSWLTSVRNFYYSPSLLVPAEPGLYILLQAHSGKFSHCVQQLFIFILLNTNSVFYFPNCPQAVDCLSMSIISSHIMYYLHYQTTLNVIDCLI